MAREDGLGAEGAEVTWRRGGGGRDGDAGDEAPDLLGDAQAGGGGRCGRCGAEGRHAERFEEASHRRRRTCTFCFRGVCKLI